MFLGQKWFVQGCKSCNSPGNHKNLQEQQQKPRAQLHRHTHSSTTCTVSCSKEPEGFTAAAFWCNTSLAANTSLFSLLPAHRMLTCPVSKESFQPGHHKPSSLEHEVPCKLSSRALLSQYSWRGESCPCAAELERQQEWEAGQN